MYFTYAHSHDVHSYRQVIALVYHNNCFVLFFSFFFFFGYFSHNYVLFSLLPLKDPVHLLPIRGAKVFDRTLHSSYFRKNI